MEKTFEMINFDTCKNMTAVKNMVRATAFDMLYDAFVAIVGEDNVSKVVTDEKGTKEVAVAIGTKTDSDGFPVEVCFTVKATAKEWEERKTTTGKRVEMFDREFSASEYQRLEQEKIDKAEKAKAEKERKAKERQLEKEAKAKAKASKEDIVKPVKTIEVEIDEPIFDENTTGETFN